jgi:hypothetical protein
MNFKILLLLVVMALFGLVALLFFRTMEKHPVHPMPQNLPLNVIVYVCDDGDQEICVIHADGSGFQKLTGNITQDYRPVMNRHGQIAFICNRDSDGSGDTSPQADLCVVNMDGSGLTRLSNHFPLNYSEYPAIDDEGEIFYICFNKTLSIEICSVNFDGTGSKILTDNNWTEFALSVDSHSGLAFICVPAGSASFFDTEICKMKTDGSDFRQVTHNDLLEWGAVINETGIILSNCDKDLLHHAGLCLIYPPNDRFVVLSSSTIGNKYSLNNQNQIAFQCYDGHDSEICVMQADGSGLKYLTVNESGDTMPSINDAGVVAYLCDKQLCVIHADGTGWKRLFGPGILSPVTDMSLEIK